MNAVTHISTTSEFPFKHTRCIQPHLNADLTITKNVKLFLTDDFEITHELLKQIDDGYDQGDALCDAWIAEAKTLKGHGMKLFRQALESGIETVKDAPESLKALFAQTDTIPDWVDRELMMVGSRALERYPLKQSLILQSSSLMGGYSIPGLSEPLLATKSLSRSVVARIARTLGFTAAVTIPGGLDWRDVGYKQALNTRVIHGLVRANLKSQADWGFARFGLPVSQTDMIATGMGSSLVLMHGLLRFKCALSQEEREAILHIWRYAQYLLGIDDDLLPKGENACNEWFYTYLMSQELDGSYSRELAQALHELPLLIENNPRFIPLAKVEQQLRAGLTRSYWGDEICDGFGLPNPKWATHALNAMTGVQVASDHAQRHSKQLQRIMARSASWYSDRIKDKYLVAKPDLKPLFDEIQATYDKNANQYAA